MEKNAALSYLHSLADSYRQKVKEVEKIISDIEKLPEIIDSESEVNEAKPSSSLQQDKPVKHQLAISYQDLDSLPLPQRVIELLSREKRFMHSSEICEKLAVNSGTLSSRLSKMVKANSIKRVMYNNHYAYIFYGLGSFLKNENGQVDFKNSSYEPIGEKTSGMNRQIKLFS